MKIRKTEGPDGMNWQIVADRRPTFKDKSNYNIEWYIINFAFLEELGPLRFRSSKKKFRAYGETYKGIMDLAHMIDRLAKEEANA